MSLLKTVDSKIALVLFILAFLLFANTLGHDFAWDDSIVITDNSRVQKGFRGIPDLFLKRNSDYKEDKYGYRPIVLTSFAVEYGFFGLNPKPGHFMNVLYFAILCVVMYKVLRKLFYKFSNLFPFLITLVFLVHPIHVEVVANIKSRDEIFALLFSLLSLNEFITFNQTKKVLSIFLSFFFFMLAFLSKESAITFIAVIPLAFFYLQDKPDFKKALGLGAIVAPVVLLCFLIVKLYSTSSLGVESSKGAGIYYENGILGNSFFHTSLFGTKLANAFTILALYLKNFFYPVNLVYFYGYNQIPVANWQQPLVIFSCILHLGLLAFAILKFKKYREISFGILFYFISISVYLHILRTLADTMADRFLFTPSLGLIIATVSVLGILLKMDLQNLKLETLLGLDRTKKNQDKVEAAKNNKVKYTFLVVALLLSTKTFNRNKVWKNDVILTSTDMPKLENCARAHVYYANMLKSKLFQSFNAETEREMIAHYEKSFTITKASYYAYLGLATYYCNANRFSEGVPLLKTFVDLYPTEADPNFYLGQALYHIKEYKKAVWYLEKALRLSPEVLNSYYFLAVAYSKNGNFDKAISTITSAKNKFGESGLIYDAFGNIYFDQGDLEQSTKYTFEQLRFGENPQKVYGTVIGRYQVKKEDKPAKFYYDQARSKGIFK